MKPQTSLAVIVFLLLSLTSLDARDRDVRYFSYIIRSSDASFEFDLPANLYMKVVNFSQIGTVGNSIGGVFVTKNGVQATVMIANTTNPVYVAGPCTVTIPSVSGNTVFVTFLLGWN